VTIRDNLMAKATRLMLRQRLLRLQTKRVTRYLTDAEFQECEMAANEMMVEHHRLHRLR
jgi:hypothetical protein